ncbi:hypothetical protein RvY_11252-1 [Ramazzottius varieornatus]|uniref:Palmitoyl-protein thioesterase 1 n=1 Tax=Ramazzottius varieornatus TaxID=947166 RepID=A0A1D1VPD4_RAMVA|nr:hypothetical protein RvY_11252-1 [Ramazzottius varieornatus]
MARPPVFSQLLLILLSISLPCIPGVSSYRPVVVVHGIMDNAMALFDLQDAITTAHPGTEVFLIPMFQRMKSAWPMWTQVLGFGQSIKNISDTYRDTGINIIGYSQGGLIARGVIQVCCLLDFVSQLEQLMSASFENQHCFFRFSRRWMI